LSDRQLIVRIGDASEPFVVAERTPAEVAGLSARVERFAATLGDALVMPLDMAVDPGKAPEPGLVGGGELQAVSLARPQGGPHSYGLALLYVATPQLLDGYGVDPSSLGIHEVFSVYRSVLLFDKGRSITPLAHERIGPVQQASVPNTFITPEGLRRRGWEQVRAGWFIEADRALTGAEKTAARRLAVDAGLTMEVRDDQASIGQLQTGATAGGTLLALGVLAMTVGLIRSEAAGDLRTLAAAGASTTVRRTLTATTAGALALLGVVLGIVGAYLALVGASVKDLDHVPVAHLVVLAVGVPVLAAVAGFVLAGRQPESLTRSPLA
jgi:putative ABC transport system permease protein